MSSGEACPGSQLQRRETRYCRPSVPSLAAVFAVQVKLTAEVPAAPGERDIKKGRTWPRRPRLGSRGLREVLAALASVWQEKLWNQARALRLEHARFVVLDAVKGQVVSLPPAGS